MSTRMSGSDKIGMRRRCNVRCLLGLMQRRYVVTGLYRPLLRCRVMGPG